jgi:insertion element IS1 protein InsB
MLAVSALPRKALNKQAVGIGRPCDSITCVALPALDRETREIVGVAIGTRDEATACELWTSLPAVYRQCAVCDTDLWQAYAAVLPSKRHRAVVKKRGETSHIERPNNTCRQRVSRLVRRTLSFSKKVANHIGAVWYYVHHHNALMRA